MKKILKNAFEITIIAGLMLSMITNVIAIDPSYQDITIAPEEPTRESEVTFTVEIEGENITEVRVIVEECNDIFCYQDIQNESMTNTQDNIWEGTVTLLHDDTTYGTVWLEILSDEKWYDFKESGIEFDVVASSENGDDGENGDNGSNGGNGGDSTPGFELILLVISIIVAFSIYKKKRIR